MIALRELERIETRVLAALRIIDAASGLPVDADLRVTALDTSIFRNRSGLYVIRYARQLASHRDAFIAPPASPEPGSVPLEVLIEDPRGQYLARRSTVRLPRDPSPANATVDTSLFRAIDVEMYRTPAGPLAPNWVPLRVALTNTGGSDALGGALLRVSDASGVRARGLTDLRGEALVPVVGIPITTWSEDETSVMVTETDATLEIAFDVANGGVRTSRAALDAGLAPTTLLAPNPAAIEANPAAIRRSVAVRLATGRSLFLPLTLDLPG